MEAKTTRRGRKPSKVTGEVISQATQGFPTPPKERPGKAFDPTYWDDVPYESHAYGSQMKAIAEAMKPWLKKVLGHDLDVGFQTENSLLTQPNWRPIQIENLIYHGAWENPDAIKRQFNVQEYEGSLAWMGYTGETPHLVCVQPVERRRELRKRRNEMREEKLRAAAQPKEGPGMSGSTGQVVEEKLKVKAGEIVQGD